MRRLSGLLAVPFAFLAASGLAEACHTCKKTPCSMPARPAYECVTEMVPYTVMKTRVRTEFEPVQKTVMVRQPILQQVERQRVVTRPVYETTYVQQPYTVTRQVRETTYVDQAVTVCRPVSTTRQVAVTCMQPVSQVVTRPAKAKHHGLLNLCHGAAVAGCVSVVETCYVPTVEYRDVVETQMVSEVQYRKVPVTTCRWVTEQRIRNIPIRHCRMVQEVVTDRRTVCVGYQCVPKVVTRYVPRKVCETVPVTKYRKVVHRVPVCPPTMGAIAAVLPATLPAAQDVLIPSPQAAASGQH
jgi:hypothetical protein